MSHTEKVNALEQAWKNNARWKGVERTYGAEEVIKLSGSFRVEHTLARMGAERLYSLLHSEHYVAALGAYTGNMAIQQVQAGLKAIYLSGWQVAADANLSGHMYPDQSLYPADSVPAVVRRINQALTRADQIQTLEGDGDVHWMAPIIADAEAGFGGNLNAFELMKGMIEAGAAAVHFEDQLASAKKCGHLGGKVLVPTQEFIGKLNAARLAADVLGVPTLLIARTDADAANLLTSDIDERDQKFINGNSRTSEGFYHVKPGLAQAIDRAISYAPYADLIWCETSRPDLGQAREFAQAVREKYPHQLLAYNCSPSFNWKKNLDDRTMMTFREQLADMGYRFQFITLAGFHALNTALFELSSAYHEGGMYAYSQLQQKEFALTEKGFRAVKHQQFVGTGYFDAVQQVVNRDASTAALSGSTETEQFH